MATIVQDYGPIYGEVVNGTVQGRPNGSVYVPESNVITLQYVGGASTSTVTLSGGSYNLSVKVDLIAKSQDLASNMRIGLYSDSDCTTLFANGYRTFPAGQFNFTNFARISGSSNTDAPVSGTTYYIRAELVNNGSVVAVSSVLECVG